MSIVRIILAALLLLAGLPVRAEGRVTGADLLEIRGVIHRQIEAFRRDDARSAFALASPGVQRAFGSAQRFMETVRMAYRPVYRPARFAFLEPTLLSGEVVQQVQIVDRSGGVWLAYYSMQRQDDGSWRTNGCYLSPPVRVISASLN